MDIILEKINYKEHDSKIVGDIGEAIIKHHFSANLSENYYDNVKDGYDFFGKSFEVKTQARMHYDHTLSCALSQSKKCLNIDRLIFVEYDDTSYIKIWEVINKNNYVRYTTNSGLRKMKWYIKEMISLAVIYNVNVANTLRKYSNAYGEDYKSLRNLISE